MSHTTTSPSTRAYRSKIDGWHILLVAALFLQGCLMLWVYDPLPLPFFVHAGWLVVGLGVLATLSVLTVRYEITDTELTVRFLMLRLRIPLAAIEKEQINIKNVPAHLTNIMIRFLFAKPSIRSPPTFHTAAQIIVPIRLRPANVRLL